METVVENPNKEILDKLVQSVEDNANYYTEISDNIIKAYTQDFDNLMLDLKRDIIENDADDLLLEKYVLELNNMLYFLGDKLEHVGIKDDISKMAAKEVFNNMYLQSREKDSERKNKLTVAELTALSEDASKYETILNSIYNRVYKQIKFKMDAGYDMVNTIRKIITKRIQDASLSMYSPNVTIRQPEEF